MIVMVELLFFISGAVSFACIYWIYRLVSDAPQLQLKNSERDRVNGVFDADGSISCDASQTTVSQPLPKKEEDHQIEVSRGGIDAGDLELIKDVLHSSAQQSQAMLVSLDRSEAERSKLMKFLSQSKKGLKQLLFGHSLRCRGILLNTLKMISM